MVLRDTFQSKSENVTVGMIACVSPGFSHADHSLNTIRYAERLKEFPSVKSYEKISRNSGVLPTPVRKKGGTKKTVESAKSNPKRALWGKPSRKKVIEERKQEEEQDDEEEIKMRTKKGQNEDWQLLKQTLRHGGSLGTGTDSPGTVHYHDQANDILEMREDLIQKHMKYIREVALLLKQEGELITRVQGIDTQDGDRYPIDKYAEKMRYIVKKNLQIYADLDKDLEKFQGAL